MKALLISICLLLIPTQEPPIVEYFYICRPIEIGSLEIQRSISFSRQGNSFIFYNIERNKYDTLYIYKKKIFEDIYFVHRGQKRGVVKILDDIKIGHKGIVSLYISGDLPQNLYVVRVIVPDSDGRLFDREEMIK